MGGRYLDTVLDGAPNPAPGEAGRENLRVVLAAYEAARMGLKVKVEKNQERPDENQFRKCENSNIVV